MTEAQAWHIAKTVFRWQGADQIREDRKDECMIASIGPGFFFYDAAMCVWLEPVDGHNTMVSVETKRSNLTEAPSFTETAFYWRFSQAVEIVNAGKPLPVSPPD